MPWCSASQDAHRQGTSLRRAKALARSRRPNQLTPRMDGDFLSEDFCIIGGDSFFVRGVLEIPVHGLAEKFGFGSWSSLSRPNFDLYVERFDDGDYAGLGPWSGWFSNRL
jgi:hypothetical protein